MRQNSCGVQSSTLTPQGPRTRTINYRAMHETLSTCSPMFPATDMTESQNRANATASFQESMTASMGTRCIRSIKSRQRHLGANATAAARVFDDALRWRHSTCLLASNHVGANTAIARYDLPPRRYRSSKSVQSDSDEPWRVRLANTSITRTPAVCDRVRAASQDLHFLGDALPSATPDHDG